MFCNFIFFFQITLFYFEISKLVFRHHINNTLTFQMTALKDSQSFTNTRKLYVAKIMLTLQMTFTLWWPELSRKFPEFF